MLEEKHNCAAQDTAGAVYLETTLSHMKLNYTPQSPRTSLKKKELKRNSVGKIMCTKISVPVRNYITTGTNPCEICQVKRPQCCWFHHVWLFFFHSSWYFPGMFRSCPYCLTMPGNIKAFPNQAESEGYFLMSCTLFCSALCFSDAVEKSMEPLFESSPL